jgi:2-oxoglutarate ferredoxin oxidoreductase subunit gamma
MRREIRVSGFGGQGVIMCGYIIGQATSIVDGRNATMTQAFGPEARGSACSCQVIVDDDKVLYPYVREVDILVAMSQEAYTKFSPSVAPNGTILIENELVTPESKRDDVVMYGIPSTRIAEEIGGKIVQNIVMIGFFTAMTDVATFDSMKKAVLDSVPPGTEKLNTKAFESGYEFGRKLKAQPA